MIFIGILLLLVAGLAEGVQDKINFHYDRSIFKYWNKLFWDINQSYLNKYIDRDSSKGETFRGKYLVFTTDGWHLMKFISRWSTYIGLFLIIISFANDSNVLKLLYTLVTSFLSRSLTFNLVWKLTDEKSVPVTIGLILKFLWIKENFKDK